MVATMYQTRKPTQEQRICHHLLVVGFAQVDFTARYWTEVDGRLLEEKPPIAVLLSPRLGVDGGLDSVAPLLGSRPAARLKQLGVLVTPARTYTKPLLSGGTHPPCSLTQCNNVFRNYQCHLEASLSYVMLWPY